MVYWKTDKFAVTKWKINLNMLIRGLAFFHKYKYTCIRIL